MSQKLKKSLGLTLLLALAVPIAWATASLTSDAKVDAAELPLSDVDMPEAPPELGPINVPLQDALYRSGLDPEALAAAGVTAGDLAGICTAITTELVEVQPILNTADAGVSQGRTDVGRLSRLVRSGKGSPEDVQALAQAKTDCDAALAERDNCMNAYHAAACAGLTEGKRNALTRIRANREWKLPTPYLVVDRTPEEWMQLQEYLDVERIEARWGHELDPEVASTLAAVRNNPDYASAQAAYDTNLAAIKTAANLAIRD